MDFAGTKTVAVVGVSGNPERDSHRVAKYLQEAGYRVMPVNPGLQEVLGEKCYSDLAGVPPEIIVDVVDIFRKSDQVDPIVDQAVQRGVKVVWMQIGVANANAAERAREAGVEVIMDRCMMLEHRKWVGGRS